MVAKTSTDALPPVTPIHWTPSWRLVPSVFPPQSLFDRVADADDLDAVLAIESMTNARIRDEIGELSLVPRNERQVGPGTTPIMASFTHINPEGSRFSDGTFGVYYAAKQIETAIAETQYHREKFLQRTQEPAMEIDMRSYASDIDCTLHDIRGFQSRSPALYDLISYAHSQALASNLKAQQSNGLVYDSVRHQGGECVGIFKANIPQRVVQGSHYCFCWDGTAITDTYVKASLTK